MAAIVPARVRRKPVDLWPLFGFLAAALGVLFGVGWLRRLVQLF